MSSVAPQRRLSTFKRWSGESRPTAVGSTSTDASLHETETLSTASSASPPVAARSLPGNDASVDIPETHYAPTPDGGLIAYKSIGDGPIALAHVGAAATQIEVMWEIRAQCAVLARSRILRSVDRARSQGTGPSDAGAGLPDLETRAADLGAVLDDAGVSRARSSFGTQDGGMVCALFAAAHPERAASFYWPFPAAKGTRASDWPLLPLELDVPDPIGDEYEIDRPVADDLVGDVDVSAFREPDLRDVHAKPTTR